MGEGSEQRSDTFLFRSLPRSRRRQFAAREVVMNYLHSSDFTPVTSFRTNTFSWFLHDLTDTPSPTPNSTHPYPPSSALPLGLPTEPLPDHPFHHVPFYPTSVSKYLMDRRWGPFLHTDRPTRRCLRNSFNLEVFPVPRFSTLNPYPLSSPKTGPRPKIRIEGFPQSLSSIEWMGYRERGRPVLV